MVRTSLDTWLCWYMRTSGIGWTSISWQTGRVTRQPHFARCERVLPFQLESVNEGHLDRSAVVLPLVGPSACINVAITVRGGVLKFTHVVDKDTTVHGVHTHTVAFSPPILIKCAICPYHQSLTRTSPEWLKKAIHDR